MRIDTKVLLVQLATRLYPDRTLSQLQDQPINLFAGGNSAMFAIEGAEENIFEWSRKPVNDIIKNALCSPDVEGYFKDLRKNNSECLPKMMVEFAIQKADNLESLADNLSRFGRESPSGKKLTNLFMCLGTEPIIDAEVFRFSDFYAGMIIPNEQGPLECTITGYTMYEILELLNISLGLGLIKVVREEPIGFRVDISKQTIDKLRKLCDVYFDKLHS